VHVTGQIAFDENREVVGKGDVVVQIRLCFQHIERILDGFGGVLGDIVTLTAFYTDAGQVDRIRDVWAEAFDKSGAAPACVMIQVAGLVHPDLLIELIPTAVIPEDRFHAPATATNSAGAIA
jgi:enamine deaminase RidA (YjgF/YER057c/UK114 family)